MCSQYGINREGLQHHKTFDEEVKANLFNKSQVDYPNRSATLMKNSPYMTQFENISLYELEEFQKREQTQRYIDDVIRSMARNGNLFIYRIKIHATQTIY